MAAALRPGTAALAPAAVQQAPLFAVLAGLGALPFVAFAVLNLAGIDSVPLAGPVRQAAAIYGLVIASFMAGAHWGTYLYTADRAPANLFFSSNALAIFVWLCFMIGGPSATLVGLLPVFAFLLAIDSGLYRRRLVSAAYFRTRCVVTGVVGVSLLATLL